MAADINLIMVFQWEGKERSIFLFVGFPTLFVLMISNRRGAGNLNPAVWPRHNVTQRLSVTFVNLMNVEADYKGAPSPCANTARDQYRVAVR